MLLLVNSKSSWSHWVSLLSSAEYRLRLLLLIPPWFAVGMSSYGIHFSVRYTFIILSFALFFTFKTHIKWNILLQFGQLWYLSGFHPERLCHHCIHPYPHASLQQGQYLIATLFYYEINLTLCWWYFQSLRSPLLLLIYPVDGLLAMSFYFLPAEAITSRVVVFILAQALIIASFFLIDAFTPELFSTDARNSTFSFLDSLSKVSVLLQWYRTKVA